MRPQSVPPISGLTECRPHPRTPSKSRRSLHLLLVLWVFAAATLAYGQQDVLTEISVHGNRRIPQDTIKARVFTRPGDTYDAQGLERDFNSLWNTGYFEDVRFEREQTAKGWRLHIYVTERPTIREITYVGLNSVTTSDVLDRFKLRKVGVSQESQYDPTKVKKAEVALKELLSEHGRQFAVIRTEIRKIPPAAVGVTFNIKEGPKVKVGNIKFEGNKSINSRTLRASMKNSKPIGIPNSIFLENLFAKTFDSSKLEEDAERVRFEYQKRGYFKALVGDPKTKMVDTGSNALLFVKQGKAVDITVPVEEGERYRLGKITFKGNKAVSNTAALRNFFGMKDGDWFNAEAVRKGLENLRKAYGELGYINFTPIPDTVPDDEKKTIDLNIDLDEGKQFYVRRIEFQGNTTTRDKVIRREVVLEEGNVYNSRLWEYSLLRLNQLQYFEALKPDDPNITDRRLDEKNGLVDLTLKLHEKGKNSISLQGGVSGLSGAFVGVSYETNNFLGLGETLSIQAQLGNRQRNLLFGFTEPYLRDKPLQLGATVFTRRYTFDQAKNSSIQAGRQLNISQDVLQQLQNFTQASTGFTTSLSYPLRRSLKRIGITYSYDTSSTTAFTNASKRYFELLNFRGISGPNSLTGVNTSKVIPNFSFSTIDNPAHPHKGTSVYFAGEFAGIGGNVNYFRPIVQYKHWVPLKKNALGFNLQGSFLSGFNGLAAPPFERFYLGGENDLRGFDTRSVTPYALLPDRAVATLTNPDGSAVPLDPSHPTRGGYTINLPVQRVIFAGGDTSFISNTEYRIGIAGPVVLAPFVDFGFNGIVRTSQLKIAQGQFDDITTAVFGCPARDNALNCVGGIAGSTIGFKQDLQLVPGTNFKPRMSTGLELQVQLPIINAPFRVYYAYNPLRLNERYNVPALFDRSYFPAGAAGDYTFEQFKSALAPQALLREPLHTFRFSVATTF